MGSLFFPHKACVHPAPLHHGDKIAFHCSGGEGRTGLALGLVLHSECGLSAEEAADAIKQTAAKENVVRKVTPDKIQVFMKLGHA